MTFTASLSKIIKENHNGLLHAHSEWLRVELSEVATVLNGFAFSSKQFSPDKGTPLIRIRDILRNETNTYFDGEFDSTYLIEPGDLLIGMDGDFNCTLWSGRRALLNQRVCKITPNESFYDRRFMYYALPGYLAAINAHTSSMTVKHLSSRTVADIPLPLPPVEQQRRIVSKIEELFSDLDAGVAALERAKANLKRYRAAVLKAAVEGKLTEQWRAENPDVEPATELLKRILAERRERWEAEQLAKYEAKGKKPPKGWKDKYKEPAEPDVDGLPELPATWCWATANQLTDETRAITYGVVKLGKPIEDGVPTLRSSNVRSLFLDLEYVKPISPEIAERYQRTVLEGGELLVTVRGTLGGIVTVPESCRGFNISREVAMLALIEPRLGRALALFIASRTIQNWIMRHTRGIAYTGINIQTLKDMPLPVAPIEEFSEIVDCVHPRLSTIEQAESEIDKTTRRSARLRQSILKRAFEGKLVPQDTNDEPASELLARIKAERAAAEANGRKQKRKRSRIKK